jgi:hypothetical protein
MWRRLFFCVVVISVTRAAVGPTYDAVRAPLRAEQARVCWPPALYDLVNLTLAGMAPAADPERAMGRFFAVFAAAVRTGRPVCDSYALATVNVLRREYVRQNVVVPTDAQLRDYCVDMLQDDVVVTAALPSDNALRTCMREAELAAVMGYAE